MGVDGLMNARCLAAYVRLEGNYLLEVLRGSSKGETISSAHRPKLLPGRWPCQD